MAALTGMPVKTVCRVTNGEHAVAAGQAIRLIGSRR